MPKPSPELYNLKKTAFWFAIASIVLVLGLLAMIFQDSHREWKGWQRKFMKYSQEKTEKELEEVQKTINQDRLIELKENLKTYQEEMKAKKSEIKALEKENAKLDLAILKMNSKYQNLKQFQDSDRYFFEEHEIHGETQKAADYKAKMDAREPELTQAKLELENLEKEKSEKEAELKKWTDREKEIQREIDKINRDAEQLQTKIKTLKPSLVKGILNAPMLDFMKPTLQIQQIVVENLHDDYYFKKVEKVDRCITCHLGVDQKGFEDAPAPFQTHPNLELFLSPDSPHPMEEFGCTSCHGGNGHSVSFTTAAHTPQNEEQAKEWKKEYHWHAMKHWSDKMLPLNHVEASCAKCHQGVVDVPKAPHLNEGRQLAQTFGCFGCHKVEGFENRWLVGPSLEHVQSKLEQDWIVRWLQNPKEFRPSTKMPRIFHLSNTSDEESTELNNAAIAGIAAYLMKNSDPVTLENPPKKGNPEEGERLVNETGCLGCHTAGSMKANNFGPELSGMGSKVKADWLYTWVKNPKHYNPNSRMPNLRLTDQEASDIVSYLLQDKNEKFESIRLPLVKPEAVDELALVYMTSKMRHEEAKDRLSEMNDEEKLEFVGQKMIARQGCFGCHTIKGFEDAAPIGVELTGEADKELARFDFGFTHIDHTKRAWFFQKLKEPRIFDHGKVRSYNDKLRMPQFDFTDEQAEALTTFLLSLKKTEVPLEMQKRLTIKEKQVEAGRLLIQENNCQGCHTMDGKEGAVRSIIDDPGNAPPVLDGEGAKVQEVWLYHFLEKPITIRPWLTYRMPTFGFSEEELTTFIQYFNHLSDVEPSYKGIEIPETTPKDLKIGGELFEQFQCIKCHQSEVPAGLTASFLAPDLVMSKHRLRPEWVIDWLKDPQAIQEGTMMPGFWPDGESPLPDVLDGNADRQIKAIRDYLMNFTAEDASKLMGDKS